MQRPSSHRRKSFNLAETVTLFLLLLAVILYVFVSYHSHAQLGNNMHGPSKIFVQNRLEKTISNMHLQEKVLELETLLNHSWTDFARPTPQVVPDKKSINVKPEVSSKINPLVKNAVPSKDVNALHAKILPEASRRKRSSLDVWKERKDNWEPLQCPNDAKGPGDLVSYWRKTTKSDLSFRSPFADVGPVNKYVTFEPDVGGWNNIRMQMETVLVFAAATGRTLVIPPDQPLYLLNKGKGHENHHSFQDFFPFDKIATRVNVITMKEFMAREAVTGHLFINGSVAYPPKNKTEFSGIDRTDKRSMWFYLRDAAANPTWECMKEFVVIPIGPGINASTLPNGREYEARKAVFASKRKAYYYDEYWQSQSVIHFQSTEKMRLLSHFYTFIHFEDVAVDRLFKRFIRDYVHYKDAIFCSAAIIVKNLLRESNGNGYSAFHIRRGELQYKEVKIPASELMKNVGQFIPKGQLLYVATDERNKSFFLPLYDRFPRVRFLDDYWDKAGLQNVNPNFLGMIEQVVCSRGDSFVGKSSMRMWILSDGDYSPHTRLVSSPHTRPTGTWFSTFSGYITRMRGYLGYPDNSVWYGDKNHRDRFQVPEVAKFPFYMREWNVSWDGIDSDVRR